MTQFTKPGTHLEQHSMLNNFFLELQYCAVFRRESRKFAGEVWQYAKFRHFLANRVVKAGPPKNPINNFSIHTQCPPHGLRSSCAERASTTMTNAEAGIMQVEHTADWFGGAWFFFCFSALLQRNTCHYSQHVQAVLFVRLKRKKIIRRWHSTINHLLTYLLT